MTRASSTLLCVLLAVGCTPAPIAEERVGGLDVTAYVEEVHPVVRFSCASLDCHGVAGRPLRLYAEEGLRMRGDLRGTPLSGEEARWNVAAFAGVDPGAASPEASLSLAKPVAGEITHAGGDVWPSRSDPGYRCVRAWLAGESARAENVAACTEARIAVDPYPPDGGP